MRLQSLARGDDLLGGRGVPGGRDDVFFFALGAGGRVGGRGGRERRGEGLVGVGEGGGGGEGDEGGDGQGDLGEEGVGSWGG